MDQTNSSAGASALLFLSGSRQSRHRRQAASGTISSPWGPSEPFFNGVAVESPKDSSEPAGPPPLGRVPVALPGLGLPEHPLLAAFLPPLPLCGAFLKRAPPGSRVSPRPCSRPRLLFQTLSELGFLRTPPVMPWSPLPCRATQLSDTTLQGQPGDSWQPPGAPLTFPAPQCPASSARLWPFSLLLDLCC